MKYNLAARIFHWLMAIGFLFMWACGYTMMEFVEDDSKLQLTLFGLHISVGVSLLFLLVGRIVVRLSSTPPPLPDDLTYLERVASRAVHAALYVLPIAIIVLGWASVNMGGHVVQWFSIAMPTVFPEGDDNLVEEFHKWLAYAMLCIAAVHIGAVAKHRWLDGHDVLRRMV